VTKPLTFTEFSKLSSIVQRLAPLLVVIDRPTEMNNRSIGGSLHPRSSLLSASSSTADASPCAAECTICCNFAEDTSVLPCCRHNLCRECEARWVREHLMCPFCRSRFVNQRDVRCSSWELTTWPPRYLEAEITMLESQLASFWRSCAERADIDAGEYTEVTRSLEITEDDGADGFVIVQKADGALPPPPSLCVRV
jgi:hypothetical protein